MRKRKWKNLQFTTNAETSFSDKAKELIQEFREDCQRLAHKGEVDEVSETHVANTFGRFRLNNGRSVTNEFVIGLGWSACGGGIDAAVHGIGSGSPTETVIGVIISCIGVITAMLNLRK